MGIFKSLETLQSDLEEALCNYQHWKEKFDDCNAPHLKKREKKYKKKVSKLNRNVKVRILLTSIFSQEKNGDISNSVVIPNETHTTQLNQ